MTKTHLHYLANMHTPLRLERMYFQTAHTPSLAALFAIHLTFSACALEPDTQLPSSEKDDSETEASEEALMALAGDVNTIDPCPREISIGGDSKRVLTCGFRDGWLRFRDYPCHPFEFKRTNNELGYGAPGNEYRILDDSKPLLARRARNYCVLDDTFHVRNRDERINTKQVMIITTVSAATRIPGTSGYTACLVDGGAINRGKDGTACERAPSSI